MRHRSGKFSAAMQAYDGNRLDEAMPLMEECAREGDPVACFTMALWLRESKSDSEAASRSTFWLGRLEQLADEGNSEAQWELGQNYRFGNILSHDIQRANYWLLRAAESGNAEAQHHLGWYLETGEYGYLVDKAEAAKWYLRAFEQEHAETLYLYAIRSFQNGRPTDESFELLRKAADKGLMVAKDVLQTLTH